MLPQGTPPYDRQRAQYSAQGAKYGSIERLIQRKNENYQYDTIEGNGRQVFREYLESHETEFRMYLEERYGVLDRLCDKH